MSNSEWSHVPLPQEANSGLERQSSISVTDPGMGIVVMNLLRMGKTATEISKITTMEFDKVDQIRCAVLNTPNGYTLLDINPALPEPFFCERAARTAFATSSVANNATNSIETKSLEKIRLEIDEGDEDCEPPPLPLMLDCLVAPDLQENARTPLAKSCTKRIDTLLASPGTVAEYANRPARRLSQAGCDGIPSKVTQKPRSAATHRYTVPPHGLPPAASTNICIRPPYVPSPNFQAIDSRIFAVPAAPPGHFNTVHELTNSYAPKGPGIAKVCCTSESTYIFWAIDKRKLGSHDKQIVSPMFDIDLKGNEGLQPFRLVLHPSADNDGRRGASLTKSQGKGRIELKCEVPRESGSPYIVFRFAVGRNQARQLSCAAAASNFAGKASCGLPRGTDEWDFCKAVDEYKTFLVILEVVQVMADSSFGQYPESEVDTPVAHLASSSSGDGMTRDVGCELQSEPQASIIAGGAHEVARGEQLAEERLPPYLQPERWAERFTWADETPQFEGASQEGAVHECRVRSGAELAGSTCEGDAEARTLVCEMSVAAESGIVKKVDKQIPVGKDGAFERSSAHQAAVIASGDNFAFLKMDSLELQRRIAVGQEMIESHLASRNQQSVDAIAVLSAGVAALAIELDEITKRDGNSSG